MTILFIGRSQLIENYFIKKISEKHNILILDIITKAVSPSYVKSPVIKSNKSNNILYKNNFTLKNIKEIMEKYNPNFIVYDININKTNLVPFVKKNDVYVKQYEIYKNIFDIIKKHNANCNVILLSSCDVYDMIHKKCINERVIIKNNLFNYMKDIKYVEDLFNKYTFNKIILRIPIVLGTDLENTFIENKISEVLSGKINPDINVPFYNFINISFLSEVINQAIYYLQKHQNVNEIINVVNKKSTNRNVFIKKLISACGFKEIYRKHPEAILKVDSTKRYSFDSKYYIHHPRLLSYHKLYLLFGLKSNINLDDDLEETYEWYLKTHLVYQKLDNNLKNKIKSLKTSDQFSSFILKYRNNELTNLEIVNYFYKYISENINYKNIEKKYNNVTTEEIKILITEIESYLKLFKRKKIKYRINGIRYQIVRKNKPKGIFAGEYILTENNKKELYNELEYLKHKFH